VNEDNLDYAKEQIQVLQSLLEKYSEDKTTFEQILEEVKIKINQVEAEIEAREIEDAHRAFTQNGYDLDQNVSIRPLDEPRTFELNKEGKAVVIKPMDKTSYLAAIEGGFLVQLEVSGKDLATIQEHKANFHEAFDGQTLVESQRLRLNEVNQILLNYPRQTKIKLDDLKTEAKNVQTAQRKVDQLKTLLAQTEPNVSELKKDFMEARAALAVLNQAKYADYLNDENQLNFD